MKIKHLHCEKAKDMYSKLAFDQRLFKEIFKSLSTIIKLEISPVLSDSVSSRLATDSPPKQT